MQGRRVGLGVGRGPRVRWMVMRSLSVGRDVGWHCAARAGRCSRPARVRYAAVSASRPARSAARARFFSSACRWSSPKEAVPFMAG